eukprot:gene1184-1594_t
MIQKFLDEKLDVAAGVRQQLDAYAKDHPEMRVMSGHFQEINQAMGMPRVEGQPHEAGAAYLAAFVEEMKKSGFVAAALKRSGQVAQVAPAANLHGRARAGFGSASIAKQRRVIWKVLRPRAVGFTPRRKAGGPVCPSQVRGMTRRKAQQGRLAMGGCRQTTSPPRILPLGASSRRQAKGPFVALGPARSWIVFSEGGLRIDTDFRVLDRGGVAIPGLYAAGSAGQGGVLLEGHGHHLAWAFTSGRLAGRNAATAALPD